LFAALLILHLLLHWRFFCTPKQCFIKNEDEDRTTL
jgi:hypothetical protein